MTIFNKNNDKTLHNAIRLRLKRWKAFQSMFMLSDCQVYIFWHFFPSLLYIVFYMFLLGQNILSTVYFITFQSIYLVNEKILKLLLSFFFFAYLLTVKIHTQNIKRNVFLQAWPQSRHDWWAQKWTPVNVTSQKEKQGNYLFTK